MSADNWAICPVCKKRNDVAYKKQTLDVANQYGKIPDDEYIVLVKETKPIVLKESLREDYQIGVDEEGVFSFVYSCNCSECGFKFIKKANVPLKLN